MRNYLLPGVLAACLCCACTVRPEKSQEENFVEIRVEKRHFLPSEVLHLKSYYLTSSGVWGADTLVWGYNSRSHALDVMDVRADTIGEIHLDREGDQGVTGRVEGMYVHTPDSIWLCSEAMLAYLVDGEGRVRQKIDLHASLREGEEVSVKSHHAVCTSRLFYDGTRGVLLYGVVDRSTKPYVFKVRELDVRTGTVVRDYPLQPSLVEPDVSHGYANMNRVNLAFHDSLVVYNYPIESHIYVLDRNSGATRVVEADSRYTDNRAAKCESGDYALWERHQVENLHFFDVMYLPAAGLYARLHLGGIPWDAGRPLGELLDARPLYVSFLDKAFHKVGEHRLADKRYSHYTGWCAVPDGLLLFVDNALDGSEISEDLYVDKVLPFGQAGREF